MHTVKHSYFTRISWQASFIRWCNTSESLVGAEYTKGIPTAESLKDQGQRIVQASLLGLCALSIVHRKPGSGAV
jgi:hypothetical protein